MKTEKRTENQLNQQINFAGYLQKSIKLKTFNQTEQAKEMRNQISPISGIKKQTLLLILQKLKNKNTTNKSMPINSTTYFLFLFF